MKRTQCEIVNRRGVAYVVTTWDDETGDAEVLEYDGEDQLIRRCEWMHWPEPQGEIVGEAIWFDPGGNELERRPLRLSDQHSLGGLFPDAGPGDRPLLRTHARCRSENDMARPAICDSRPSGQLDERSEPCQR